MALTTSGSSRAPLPRQPTEELQTGGRAAFLARLVLAATLSASYGIYGPAFELQEHVPRSPGSEEYRHSEKYEVRTWDLDSPESLSGFIGLVNQIRCIPPRCSPTTA